MKLPRVVFADASFYTALLFGRDAYHDRAVAWRRECRAASVQLITTQAVRWEILNTFSPAPVRLTAMAAVRRVLVDPEITVIDFDPVLTQQAIELYASRSDKGWGITDCYSFIVMQQRGLVAALSSDHDFEQAGFQALLRADPSP